MVKLTLVCPSLVPRTTLQSRAHLRCAGKRRARLRHRARTGGPPSHHHRLEWAFQSRASLPGTQLGDRRGPGCTTSTVRAAICPRLRTLRCFCIFRGTSGERLLLGLVSLVIPGSMRWPAILGRGLFLLCRLALRFNSAVVGGRTRGRGAP